MDKPFPAFECGFIEADGASLYYEKKGAGESLVLVHGLGLDCRMWDDQFDVFAEQFQVIRYDLRGFGRSSLPGDRPYSHHNDLYILLKKLDIASVCLIGFSMGGRMVIDFALSFPEMTSSLIPVDAALNGYSFKTYSNEMVIAAAKTTGIEEGNKAWLAHELFEPANRTASVAAALARMISAYSGWHWLNKNPLIPLDPPAMSRLHEISKPAMVIVGELDLPDFHAIADILSENIPGSKKIVLAGVGHMCNMEEPGGFNKVVLDFLTGLR